MSGEEWRILGNSLILQEPVGSAAAKETEPFNGQGRS